ncbi:MAG: hypothetical protein QOE92_172 [Chloroflexota bacterium]|nr:hypothetical protein [Chloroflexota bacterium]
MEPQPPATVKAIQSLTLTLAVAALPLMGLVVRAIVLVSGPQSGEVFVDHPGAADLNATLVSIGLGYGLPVAVFGAGYAVAAFHVTRRRRLAFVLAAPLAVAGMVLCVTLVSQLLEFVAIVLGLFQAVLLALLLVSFRYFWSASVEAPGEPPADAGASSAAASSEDVAAGGDAPAPELSA